MRYTGILNVPRISILPMLFQRNGTYYLPITYSYNLVDDELDVDMISISAADVSLDRLEISQIAESRGTMTSGSGGSSGGGIGGTAAGELYLGELRDVNTKDAKENSILQKKGQEWKAKTIEDALDEYFKNTKKLGDWFGIDEHGIYTHKNFRSTGTLASGGAAQVGQGGGSGGTTGEYKMYTHVQGDPSSVWTINHGLNKVPNVKIIEDSTGEQVYGDVKVENMNVVTLSFGGAFSGRAYLD